MRRLLVDADFKRTDFDEIILVGGSTHIPKIHQIVKNFFTGPNTFLHLKDVVIVKIWFVIYRHVKIKA